MMLVVFACSIPALVIIQQTRALSRAAVICFIGFEIGFLSLILTPGIAWGDTDDDSVMRPISNLVFVVGLGLMIWAAASWTRARSRARSDPS